MKGITAMFVHVLIWLLTHYHHVHIPCSIKHEPHVIPRCPFR